MNRPHNQQHLFMTVAKLMRNAAIKHIWRPVCWCWVKIPAPPPRVCRGCLCCSVYGSVVSYRSKVVKLRRGCCHHDHEHMHFRYGLLAYTGPRFQNGGGSWKVLVCDSIRPSGMDLYIYWTASCVLCARNTSFFPHAHYGLFGGATSVWNGVLTESTANVRYLHRVLD